MKKVFMGIRLKRLREERRMTQQALASTLGLSLSYLNQIENNQRPLTVPVLLKLNAAFGVDLQLFSDNDEARLIADLRETLSDPQIGETISTAELRELAVNMPAVGRALVELSRQYRQALEQAAVFATQLGADREADNAVLPSTPYEEVREFFYTHHNHFPELDAAAERLAHNLAPDGFVTRDKVARYLSSQHAITVLADDGSSPDVNRRFDPRNRILYLSRTLQPGQQAFQLATQIAILDCDDTLNDLVDQARFTNQETRGIARIGLANYLRAH